MAVVECQGEPQSASYHDVILIIRFHERPSTSDKALDPTLCRSPACITTLLLDLEAQPRHGIVARPCSCAPRRALVLYLEAVAATTKTLYRAKISSAPSPGPIMRRRGPT